jgi:hypothetical protein
MNSGDSNPGSLFTENSAEIAELITIARQFIAHIPAANNTDNAFLKAHIPLCFKILNLFLDKLYSLCADNKIICDADTMIQLLNMLFSNVKMHVTQRQFLKQLHEFVRNDLTIYDFRADPRFKEICQNESQNETLNLYCGRMLTTLSLLSGEITLNETIAALTELNQKLILTSLQSYFNPRISEAFIGIQSVMPIEISQALKDMAIRHDLLITNYALIHISLNELIVAEVEEKMREQDPVEPHFFPSTKSVSVQSADVQLRKKQLLDASEKCVDGLVRCADIILSATNEYNCNLADDSPAKDHPLLCTIMSKAIASLARYKPEFHQIPKPGSPHGNTLS